MIAPNRERYGLIEFADEALDGSRTQPHRDDLIVFVTLRWLPVAEVMGVGQKYWPFPNTSGFRLACWIESTSPT
jgi:hypothetical protein